MREFEIQSLYVGDNFVEWEHSTWVVIPWSVDPEFHV
jgi:hypothetical protein